jgi:hypothetical protein
MQLEAFTSHVTLDHNVLKLIAIHDVKRSAPS